MRIQSTRFGDIECPDHKILKIPSGIIGFPASTRYLVLDHDRDVPFKWLQSLDQEELAFVIVDPVWFKPDYQVTIALDEIMELGRVEERDLILFVMLTIPSDDPGRMTANLRGPVVVNAGTRMAKQLILRDEFPTRAPVLHEAPMSMPTVAAGHPISLVECHR
jgi:flagellar assembly factor FliW